MKTGPEGRFQELEKMLTVLETSEDEANAAQVPEHRRNIQQMIRELREIEKKNRKPAIWATLAGRDVEKLSFEL